MYGVETEMMKVLIPFCLLFSIPAAFTSSCNQFCYLQRRTCPETISFGSTSVILTGCFALHFVSVDFPLCILFNNASVHLACYLLHETFTMTKLQENILQISVHAYEYNTFVHMDQNSDKRYNVYAVEVY